jgi:hypothetical protein
MSVNATTRTVTVRRVMDLARERNEYIIVPDHAIAARITVRKLDGETWSGPVNVLADGTPFDDAKALTDPATLTPAAEVASCTISRFELDGIDELWLEPTPEGAGRAEFVIAFEVVDE